MINRLLGGIGRTLIFAGVVLLLFVAYQLWGTALGEGRAQDDLTRSLGRSLGIDAAATGDPDEVADDLTARLADLDPTAAEPLEAPAHGQPGGFIEIPKIGLRTKAFVEGVAKADLRKGPGHYPTTPFPGNPGNAGIAGHRTTYGAPFNRIDELVPGDEIVTYTSQGRFVYRVIESPAERRAGKPNENWGPGWYAVRPNDVSVLAPSERNLLTLTACHPKYSARLRIIVQAELVAEPAAAPVTTAPPVQRPVDDGETVGAVDPDEDLIAGDPDELAPSLMYLGVVVAIWLVSMGLAAFLRSRDRRAWPIYIGTVAATILPLWWCFVHMDRFLPSF